MAPRFFRGPAGFRSWLKKNYSKESELLVGFYKVSTGRPSITWPEAVDQALCFGWIDGIRRRIDDTSYSIRFTPRKPRSNWSAVNIRRARELIADGRMQPSGLKAFEARPDDRSAIYSYEQRRSGRLPPDHAKRFRAEKAAWSYFQSQPEGYRQAAIWWVISAKREATQLKRLEKLIADSKNGKRLPALSPYRPAE